MTAKPAFVPMTAKQAFDAWQSYWVQYHGRPLRIPFEEFCIIMGYPIDEQPAG